VALALAVAWVALITLPVRWLRGPAHARWDWKTELSTGVFRRAVRGVAHDFARVRRLTNIGDMTPWMRVRVSLSHTSLGGRPAEELTPRNLRLGPVVLYLHGGGYVVCNPRSHRELAARVAWSTGCRTLSLDYRLAPEHPFPAALDDALAAIQALRDEGVQELWLVGDSAGGGLVASTLVAMRDRGLELPTGGVMLSPWVDLSERGLDPVTDSELDYLTTSIVRPYAEAYAADREHPLVSPLFADLGGLPPILVQLGGAETFLRQGQELVQRAREHGVDVTLQVGEGMVHVYQGFGFVVPEARRALRRVGAFVRGLKETGPDHV
jgi:epsilon-lactone hydrolase